MKQNEARESKADIIFHPVRIRIVQALFGGRRLTAGQLVEALSGPSLATLYRHLNKLVAASVVAVVEERPVRGVQEKVYALAHDRAAFISPEESRNLTQEDQRRHFTTLAGSLLDDYTRYITQDSADPRADGVVMRQEALYLSPDEARLVNELLKGTLAPYRNRAVDPSHRRYLLTTILLPELSGTSPAGSPDEDQDDKSD